MDMNVIVASADEKVLAIDKEIKNLEKQIESKNAQLKRLKKERKTLVKNAVNTFEIFRKNLGIDKDKFEEFLLANKTADETNHKGETSDEEIEAKENITPPEKDPSEVKNEPPNEPEEEELEDEELIELARRKDEAEKKNESDQATNETMNNDEKFGDGSFFD